MSQFLTLFNSYWQFEESITCISNNRTDGYWRISRFRLFRRDSGKWNFYREVPKLTSAHQEGYEVNASSNDGANHYPYLVFDGMISTKWATVKHLGAGDWIQIQLPKPTVFTAVILTSRNDEYYGQAPTSFLILGSNDGENFETISSISGIVWLQTEEKIFYFKENEIAYLYYRIEAVTIQNGSNYFGLSEVNFGYVFHEYKRDLKKYDYIIPLMSSNTQDGYIVNANSIWGGTAEACKAFNRAIRSDYDNWQSGNKTDNNCKCTNTWVQVQLPEAKICNSITLRPREDYSSYKPRTPKAFTFEGSLDGINWNVLLTVTNAGGYNSSHSWNFENTTHYYYRINITETYEANQYISICELELFNFYKIQEY